MGRFDSIAERWLDEQRSANTRDAYRRDLDCFRIWFATLGRPALEATTADIDAFRASCEAVGSSPATIARRLAAISSFYRFAGLPTNVAINPVDAARRPEPIERSATEQLTEHQCRALWRAATALGSKTATLVGLVLLDGLKTNETLMIDVGHLGHGSPPPTVAVGRRGRLDHVGLDPRTSLAADDCRGVRTDGPLFLGESPTRQPSRLTRYGADYLVKRAGRRAGLERPLTANTLRSTHISMAHANGAPLEHVRDAVGHVSARTTLRYLPPSARNYRG